MSPRHRRRRITGERLVGLPADRLSRTALAVVTVALVVTAIVALIARPHREHTALPPTPPSPSSPQSSPPIGRSTSSPPKAKTSAKPIVCGRAPTSPFGGTSPASICIPSIRVDATVMQLGLNTDRTVQVPPLSRVGDAGWYKYSAAPGADGPTVILGHVDSAEYGTGVFFRLGQLSAGATVQVSRDDGRVATYRVDRVDEVSKRTFPTQAVYGPTRGPTIRLVTCGGRFDSATGSYLDNIIVYGTLASVRSG